MKRIFLTALLLCSCGRSQPPPEWPYYAVARQGDDGILNVIDVVTEDVRPIRHGTGLEFVREDPDRKELRMIMRATEGADRGRIFRMTREQITADRPSP